MTIVVVSDVHLGSDVGRKRRGTGHATDDLALDPLFQTFMGFISKEYLHAYDDRLIFLGDIFDFWRRDAAEVLIKNQEAVSRMKEISKMCRVNYVIGNHDYMIREMWEKSGIKGLFHSMDKILHLEINGELFTFMHGHQLEVLANPYNKSEKLYDSISEMLCYTAGVTGSAASALWSLIDPEAHSDYMKSMKKPTSERLTGKHNAIGAVEGLAQAKSRMVYTGAGGWLVYGHTHRGYVDEDSKTVNTGSWGRNGDDSTLDYLIIENGKPMLCTYEIK